MQAEMGDIDGEGDSPEESVLLRKIGSHIILKYPAVHYRDINIDSFF